MTQTKEWGSDYQNGRNFFKVPFLTKMAVVWPKWQCNLWPKWYLDHHQNDRCITKMTFFIKMAVVWPEWPLYDQNDFFLSKWPLFIQFINEWSIKFSITIMTVIENSQLSVILAWNGRHLKFNDSRCWRPFSLCWWLKSCHQHISSQKSVTKVDVGFNGHFWQPIGIAW